MRNWFAGAAIAMAGCVSASSATVHTREVMEVDGRHRAIRVSMASDVLDSYQTSAMSSVSDWRAIVGQGLTNSLRETFVVVRSSGPGVLELKVLRATPSFLSSGVPAMAAAPVAGAYHGAFAYGGWGATGVQTLQVDYQARLEDDQGNVLGRATGVVSQSRSGENTFSDAVGSAVEALVNELGAKLLSRLPEEFTPSNQVSVATYTDAVAPRQIVSPASPARCKASELPEWSTASAVQKKKLLDQCR